MSIWYDLSDVKRAEALDDRASFRRFCGFSGTQATPERTAFVRLHKALIAHGLDRLLFERMTALAVTSANIDDGRAGPGALPDNPGEVNPWPSLVVATA